MDWWFMDSLRTCFTWCSGLEISLFRGKIENISLCSKSRYYFCEAFFPLFWVCIWIYIVKYNVKCILSCGKVPDSQDTQRKRCLKKQQTNKSLLVLWYSQHCIVLKMKWLSKEGRRPLCFRKKLHTSLVSFFILCLLEKEVIHRYLQMAK